MSLLKANNIQLSNNERVVFKNNDVLSKYEIENLLQSRTDMLQNTIEQKIKTYKSIYNIFLKEDDDVLDHLENVKNIEISNCNFSFSQLGQELESQQHHILNQIKNKIDKVEKLSLSNDILLSAYNLQLQDNTKIINDEIELIKEKTLPFVVQQGSNTWTPMGNYLKGTRHINQEFGNQISMSSNGQRIFVLSGAHNSIQLYQFNQSQHDWKLIHEHNDSHRYYHSIALSKDGQRYVLGDPYADDVKGHVKIYEFYERKKEWRQIGGTIMGLQYGSKMGYNVKMNFDGTHVCVSSIRYNEQDEEIGRVSIFQYNQTTNQWMQLGQHLESSKPYQYFGKSLTINHSGRCIAIGDPIDQENKGSVSVYEYNENINLWILKGEIPNGYSSMDSIGEKDTIAVNQDGSILIVSSIQQTLIYQYSEYFKSWSQIGKIEEGGKIVGINNVGNNIILGKEGFVFIYEYVHHEWKLIGEFQGEGLYGKCVAIDSTGNIIAISAPKNNEGIVLLYKKKQTNYLTMDSTHVLRDLVNHIIEEKEDSLSNVQFKFDHTIDTSNRLFGSYSESLEQHSNSVFYHYKTITQQNIMEYEHNVKLNVLSTHLDEFYRSVYQSNDSIEQQFMQENINHKEQFETLSSNIEKSTHIHTALENKFGHTIELLENSTQDNYGQIDLSLHKNKSTFSTELYMVHSKIIGMSFNEDTQDENYDNLYVNRFFSLGKHWRIAIHRHTLMFEYNDNPDTHASWRPIQPYFVKPFEIVEPKIVEEGTTLFEQSFQTYLGVKNDFGLDVAYKAGFLAEYNSAMTFFVMQYIIDNIDTKEIYIDTEDSKYEIKKISKQNSYNAYLHVDILIGKEETNRFEIIIDNQMYYLYYFHAIMVDTHHLINYH